MTAKKKSRWCCPAAFPNLLANGSSGIAVGMATSIPPHNVGEICDAALHLIEKPERARSQTLLKSSRAGFPDRRHHGRRQERDRRGLQDRARLVPPARAMDARKKARAAPDQIVITEIPYGRCRSRG